MSEQQRPGSQNSTAAAIVLLVVQALGVFACAGIAVTYFFFSDACGTEGSNCNTDQIGWGVAITGLVPAVLWVVSLIHTIVRGARDKSNWWVPLLWIAVSVVAAVTGFFVAAAGAPEGFL